MSEVTTRECGCLVQGQGHWIARLAEPALPAQNSEVMMRNAAERWRDDAACQTADPELFFPISGRGLSLLQITRAKGICGRCGVRKDCLDYALDTHQAYGVWGGRTEDERRIILMAAAPDRLRRAG